MFSHRVPESFAPNRLTEAVRAARRQGRALIDLTETNPTAVGIVYPPALLEPLADAASLVYRPEAFGLPEARRAIARDYQRRGLAFDERHIVLTASTSDAYSLLFKLLCDPAAAAVLVPAPSYPLFDHLARLDGVQTIGYRHEYHRRWEVDLDHLDQVWSADVRALLAVSPNNPTGGVLSESELDALAERCAARDAALVIDEVFADYPLHHDARTRSESPEAPCPALRFRLGGLSKSVGLPQLKLGWIGVEGPAELVGEAMQRLELICDTYLSVSTPVQVAAASLLDVGTPVRRAILDRVRGNYERLKSIAVRHPAVEVLNADAGWSAVIRVPSTRSEESLAIELVERDGVLTHPGYFFDFPREAFVVVSLLVAPGPFAEGARRLLERADA